MSSAPPPASGEAAAPADVTASFNPTVDLMPYAKKIVLHCLHGYEPRLDVMVEDFMRDGVTLVCVVGSDCATVEEMIDELVVGDGSREPYLMLTSSHRGETIAEVVEFAKLLGGELEGEVQVVELG